MRTTVFVFSFLSFFLWAEQAWGAACGAGPFYVSTSGVDTNNGTSISTPWLHHPWDANKSGLASCTLAAGNIVYMRRGDIWYDVKLASSVAEVGSAGNPIITTSLDTFYAVSSTDAYPKLSGAYNPTTLAWTRVGSTDVWFTTTVTTPGIVVYNDVNLTLYTNKTPPANNWFWSAADIGQGVNTLYVNVGGGSPAVGILEAGKQGYVNQTGAENQTFSYLEMRVNSNGTAVVYNAKANVIFDNIIIKHAFGSGIYQNTNTGAVVSHCTISDVSVYGIQAVSVPGISIHGNTISDTTKHGILLATTNGASVDNNIVHNICTVDFGCSGIVISNSNLNNVYLNNIYDNAKGYYPTGWGRGISLIGSSENNNIYRNTVARNYLGIEDVVTSGANGNKIFYNLVTDSIVNGIDMKQKGTGYDHVYNNTVIHNPSANNNEPYTGHGIDVQTSGYYTKIANNIVVNIAPYGGNNQAYAISDVGSGQPIVQVWWDNNLAYATNGGDLAKLMDTGGGGNTYAGAHNGTTWANFVTAIQGATVGHKILGMDGSPHEAGVHDVATDPLFVSSSNFHLQNTSPAINAGTDVGLTTDYEGNPKSGLNFDIGAYEFQDSTKPTTTADVDTGLYNSAQSVTLTCSDGSGVGCDKTYYTTDGIDPNTDSNQYSIPIVISSTTTLKFFSKDRNDNSETPIKSKTYTIDTIFPETTIDSNPDALINSNSATFTFSSDDGSATFQCKMDSGAYASCSTPKNYTSLAEGAHTFYVKATDAATNEDATPASYAFTVDTLIPIISDLSPNNITLSVTTTSANLTLTTSEITTCKYSTTSGTSYASMTAFDSTDNTAHATAIAGLNSGTTYDYYIICKDAINESAEEHLTFSIAPEENKISLNSVKVKIERNWNKFKDTIRIAKNKLKLKQEDDNLANGTIKIYKDNKRIDTIDINADGSWDKIIKLKDEFSGWIKIRQYDQFGTLLSTDKAKIKVDTEDPIFNETIPEKMTIGRNQKISFPATDDNSGIDYYKVKLADIRDWRQQNEDFYQIPEDVPNGTYNLFIRAYDKAGNYTEEKTRLTVSRFKNSVNLTQVPLNLDSPTQNIESQIQNHTDKNTDTAPNNSGSNNSPSPQPKLQPSTFHWWNPFSWF